MTKRASWGQVVWLVLFATGITLAAQKPIYESEARTLTATPRRR